MMMEMTMAILAFLFGAAAGFVGGFLVYRKHAERLRDSEIELKTLRDELRRTKSELVSKFDSINKK